MSFINPIFLYFLPMASIPLIIHLFNRRKYNKVEFSTLRFLEKLETNVVRKMKLKQWILLLLRTLMILFLVLAFARPVFTGKSIGGFIRKGGDLYLVIDNSSSMKLMEKGKNRVEAGIHQIQPLLERSQFPFHLKIITASEPEKIFDAGLVENSGQVSAVLKKIQPQPCAGNFSAMKAAVLDDIHKNAPASPVIWIISDFQKSGFQQNDSNPFVDLEQISGVQIIHFYQQSQEYNAAVAALEIPRQIPEKDKPLSVYNKAEQWSKSIELPVSLYLENERASRFLVTPENGEQQVRFDFVPLEPGFLTGRIGLPEDNLDFDNNRYFCIKVPDKIKLLVVGNGEQNDRFLLTALNAVSSKNIDIKYVLSERLGLEIPDQYDVLLFSDIDKMNAGTMNRLKQYLADGKGIIILPGSLSNPAAFNQLWHQEFGLPIWKNTLKSDIRDFVSFGQLTEEHPVFRNIWRGKEAGLGQSKFYVVPGFLAGSEDKVVMTYDNRYPFLIESTGQNHYALVSTAPVSGWTDLHLSGFFPVLLQRLVFYMAGTSRMVFEYETGDTVRVDEFISGFPQQIAITTPGGNRYIPERSDKNILFSATDVPGIYQIRADGQLTGKFAVNLPAEECFSEFFTAEEIQNWCSQNPDKSAIISGNSDKDIKLSDNREFSSWFILLVILFALAETWIGRINHEIQLKE